MDIIQQSRDLEPVNLKTRTTPPISRSDDGEDWNDGDGSFDLDFKTQIQHDCKTIRDMCKTEKNDL